MASPEEVPAPGTSPSSDPADGSTTTRNIIVGLVLLAGLGFGIRWMYKRLTGGGNDSERKGGGDWELEGNMRTRIDHGDL
mmetsp:Transcript_29649/g.44747  ORF Transcript_29649/g.44747 Transcript_29649/m.44747 type:complete len:80 (-) Transcript_29649:216-455(-)